MTTAPGFSGVAPVVAPPSGTSRRVEMLQETGAVNTASGWPALAHRYGTNTIQHVSQTTGGVRGFGGDSAFPSGVRPPQLEWYEGPGYAGYAQNIPIRFKSDIGECRTVTDELQIIGATMKWESLAAGAGDSGFFIATWTANVFASVPANCTNGAGGPNTRFFGVGRQNGTSQFGFFGVVGNVVTFTPIAHPGGDVRVMCRVEYRIFNARQGRSARLEVWINDALKLAAPFTAGNVLGLPFDYAAANAQTFMAIVASENLQRFWCGRYYHAQGPDELGTV